MQIKTRQVRQELNDLKWTYIIYSRCGFNTNTAPKCLWQCTEVLYILKYVIVVRGRKNKIMVTLPSS